MSVSQEPRASHGSAQLTALRESPRRAGRYVVEVDGELLGAVGAEVIGELRLRVGMLLDAASRARIADAARRLACYDKAVDALARRARSRAELGRWLRQRDFSAEEIEAALERLASLGFLDDLQFARGFARARLGTARGFGPRRVAAELARRGVERPLVDLVLAEMREEGDGTSALDAIVARRARSMQGVAPDVMRRRLYGYLARRGFEAGEILGALRRQGPDSCQNPTE